MRSIGSGRQDRQNASMARFSWDHRVTRGTQYMLSMKDPFSEVCLGGFSKREKGKRKKKKREGGVFRIGNDNMPASEC